MNGANDFLNELQKVIKAEIAGLEGDKSGNQCRAAAIIRETATALKENGCDANEIRMALLALCGVPFKPVSPLHFGILG